jgi:hypothetical protein
MKDVKLLKMVQIPDEEFTPTKDEPTPPTATNYMGAVLRVSDALADELVERGDAEYHTPDEEQQAQA